LIDFLYVQVYATDNKQTVYARIGINEENRVGTSWKAIEGKQQLS
jgi:hypothetical protein